MVLGGGAMGGGGGGMSSSEEFTSAETAATSSAMMEGTSAESLPLVSGSMVSGNTGAILRSVSPNIGAEALAVAG